MTKEEAIKYLQQLYPNGGHCWLDEQRIEAIGMAVKALQEEPKKKCMYSNDNYTDEDRKVLCDGCKEECRFNTQEIPVSEDLEAFIKERVKNIPIVLRSGFHELCRQLIRDGAQWQKQEMMKDAVPAEVRKVENFIGATTFRCFYVNKYKAGEEVKLIIIKED